MPPHATVTGGVDGAPRHSCARRRAPPLGATTTPVDEEVPD